MRTICIAGKNEIAVNALRYLYDNYPDNNYCTIPNKTDDGINGWQPSLRQHAKWLKINEVSLESIYGIKDLLLISLEFDSIIRPCLFKSQALYNIHFSALPKYKGMFTSIHPILFSERESGVTLHEMDAGIDTGNIIDQIMFAIDWSTTSRELYLKYLNYAFILFKKNIRSLIDGNYSSTKQKSSGSTYFSKKSIDFGNVGINFNKTAFEIQNQIRAFSFREYQMPQFRDWPIFKTEITEWRSDCKPGTVIAEEDGLFLISTIDYNVKLFKDYYDKLWEACKTGSYKTVNCILNYIPDINLRNAKGWNALMISVYNNHPDLAKLLLNPISQKAADINATNYKGTTVIMYALSCYQNTNDDSMLRLLVSYSPDLTKKDEKGKTIFDYVNGDEKSTVILKKVD